MPKYLEEKLKKEYGAKSKIPYKVMNKMGVMRGSNVTTKGRSMERKHALEAIKKSMKNDTTRSTYPSVKERIVGNYRGTMRPMKGPGKFSSSPIGSAAQAVAESYAYGAGKVAKDVKKILKK